LSAAEFAVDPASAADLAGLLELERRSFAEPWTAGMLAAELAHPQATLLVARRPQGPQGPPGAQGAPGAPPTAYAAFRRAADEAELLRVAVDPGVRRQGLGRRLVTAGLTLLAAQGVRRCHLEARAGNAAAIALYLALGFTLRGRRRGYYADGADAWLYSLALAAPAEPW
jgi:ribosomal-protein-alanine N-acetyltransferase